MEKITFSKETLLLATLLSSGFDNNTAVDVFVKDFLKSGKTLEKYMDDLIVICENCQITTKNEKLISSEININGNTITITVNLFQK